MCSKPSAAMPCNFDVQQNMWPITLDAANCVNWLCIFNVHGNCTLKTKIKYASSMAWSMVSRRAERAHILLHIENAFHYSTSKLHVQNAGVIGTGQVACEVHKFV
jgi:hypothetical protein